MEAVKYSDIESVTENGITFINHSPIIFRNVYRMIKGCPVLLNGISVDRLPILSFIRLMHQPGLFFAKRDCFRQAGIERISIICRK